MACQPATGCGIGPRKYCPMISLIRAPFKESWQRDLLRVNGGIADYCVIGEIDVQARRPLQSSHRATAKPFKPVPDGFEIDFGSKVLLAGEN